MRMPGPSSGVPMNSIPAVSNIAFIVITVAMRASGNPSNASIFVTVRKESADWVANSAPDIPNAARAALICEPVIT